jgi:hypothetical protein
MSLNILKITGGQINFIFLLKIFTRTLLAWCGVVWCGVVWFRVVWLGVVWLDGRSAQAASGRKAWV